MDEFSLIQNYFQRASFKRKDVVLGIGDDAAVSNVPVNQLLVTTTDTLSEGVHFFADCDPEDLAHKAVAVNLSDLAAMGAEPSWISLSLSMPSIDSHWLDKFSTKLAELTEYFSIQLIGGDTVKGPLSVTITAQGFVPPDSMLTRSGAKAGDWIFVTGSLGDAGAGLDVMTGKLVVDKKEDKQFLLSRHLRPSPRIVAGTVLRRLASSCIDVSDGLLQDIQHVLKMSETGAILYLDQIPLSPALGNNVQELLQALKYALTSGDDYELLFTVPEEHKTSVETALNNYSIPYTNIGQMTGAIGKLETRLNQKAFDISEFESSGYLHFK